MSYILLVVCVLISVAFLTLFERSGLGYIQIRKGPNKVGPLGILQPFADAIKLFTKEGVFPLTSNFLAYYVCPVLGLGLSLGVWMIYPGIGDQFDFPLGWLYFLSFVAVSVYAIIGSGWFSNSKYALLGALRAVAQTISYEVCLALVIIMLMVSVGSFNLNTILGWQERFLMFFMFLPLTFIWIVIILAETNRTPFDFAEGESELVSGFNIEYGSGGFALIFMAEYGSILFMSSIYALMFLGGSTYLLGLKVAIISFVFIWVRGLLPRYRYDKLMYLAWKILLPFTLNYFILLFGVICFI
uniref:NADH-ubiquinone oxidoreductase chain 1 n=1 Tax=Lithobius maqinensis TaxID=2250572 RepID=A0A7L7RZV5_9MYRI|nr:NADH dehydrogenase subunit 1 [Lithobius forficatus]